LLAIPDGTITEGGLRTNINVSLQYMESWLQGSGCVPINNLMEDAATVEISRAQIWQWIRRPQGILDDGRRVTIELFRAIEADELAKLEASIGTAAFNARKFKEAAHILDTIITDEQFVEFLTLPAYAYLE
jgi:malate synthase